MHLRQAEIIAEGILGEGDNPGWIVLCMGTAWQNPEGKKNQRQKYLGHREPAPADEFILITQFSDANTRGTLWWTAEIFLVLTHFDQIVGWEISNFPTILTCQPHGPTSK
jgi:hypothetical protein